MKKVATKKLAMGGSVMPAQANSGGAMRGLARAGAMSGRAMPTTGRPVAMKKGGAVKAPTKKK